MNTTPDNQPIYPPHPIEIAFIELARANHHKDRLYMALVLASLLLGFLLGALGVIALDTATGDQRQEDHNPKPATFYGNTITG